MHGLYVALSPASQKCICNLSFCCHISRMRCPGGIKKSSPVATGLRFWLFLLRKSVLEVRVVAAMLMSLQGAALGAWDFCTFCPPANAISQPSPEHRPCEWALGAEAEELLLSSPTLLCTFSLPCPDPKQ